MSSDSGTIVHEPQPSDPEAVISEAVPDQHPHHCEQRANPPMASQEEDKDTTHTEQNTVHDNHETNSVVGGEDYDGSYSCDRDGYESEEAVAEASDHVAASRREYEARRRATLDRFPERQLDSGNYSRGKSPPEPPSSGAVLLGLVLVANRISNPEPRYTENARCCQLCGARSIPEHICDSPPTPGLYSDQFLRSPCVSPIRPQPASTSAPAPTRRIASWVLQPVDGSRRRTHTSRHHHHSSRSGHNRRHSSHNETQIEPEEPILPVRRLRYDARDVEGYVYSVPVYAPLATTTTIPNEPRQQQAYTMYGHVGNATAAANTHGVNLVYDTYWGPQTATFHWHDPAMVAAAAAAAGPYQPTYQQPTCWMPQGAASPQMLSDDWTARYQAPAEIVHHPSWMDTHQGQGNADLARRWSVYDGHSYY